MVSIEKLFDIAIEKRASDIHLIKGIQPMMRIVRELVPIDDKEKILQEEDMYEIYDYLIKGSLDKDNFFKKHKLLDDSLIYKDIRFRVNISSASDVPIFTMRLIRKELPTFAELGVPDIVRRMTYQPNGFILVTGKTNSGKTTTLNALINEINETQNKKIITLENPVEYMHECKKSIIVQKEIGITGDANTFSAGVKNALREDADILVIGEIRDRATMDAGIEMAESGHLVIGTLHTKSCAETIDRIINFYEIGDQISIKYLISSLIKLVISQRLLKSTENTLVLVPEVMVVDNVIAGCIRKEKFSVSEIEDAIQGSSDKGSISLMNSIASLFVKDKITLEQAKAQFEEKNYETLNRTVMQMKIKKM